MVHSLAEVCVDKRTEVNIPLQVEPQINVVHTLNTQARSSLQNFNFEDNVDIEFLEPTSISTRNASP